MDICYKVYQVSPKANIFQNLEKYDSHYINSVIVEIYFPVCQAFV